MFQPVQKSRAFERVVEQIERAIYSGQLKAGDHLPSERALVEEFQVGRSTVREALRILESIGLLRTMPGSALGPQVSGSTVSGLYRMLHGFVRVENLSLADLVQYRMINGSAANFLAAHLRTDAHLAQLASAIKEMEATDSSATQQFAELDFRFHQAIADASGNALLNVVSGVISDLIVDLVATAISRSPDSVQTRQSFLALHNQIYDAIGHRDGERASYLAVSSLFEVYSPLIDPRDHARLNLLLPAR